MWCSRVVLSAARCGIGSFGECTQHQRYLFSTSLVAGLLGGTERLSAGARHRNRVDRHCVGSR